MKILGIETSCDETAAAVVENGTKILSNVVSTSVELHKKTGGIIPEIAARKQLEYILPVIQRAMRNAKCQIANIDAIAVTVGPGLIGSLLVGIETAKTLSYLWNKPLVPVNHLVAHIYANFICDNSMSKFPEFPVLALVVSGGHTDLVLMKNHGKFKYLGGTRDDAAGEAFDKTARILGLTYPGGPSIAAEAGKFKVQSASWRTKFQMKLFPRPMIEEDNFDWSFSGLKTAVLREIQNHKPYVLNHKSYFAAEIQEAIVDVLVDKTIKAVKKFKPQSLLIAGGVAANSRLRKKFEELMSKQVARSTKFFAPPKQLCTDNGVVIACCGFYNFKTLDWKKISVSPDLRIVQ